MYLQLSVCGLSMARPPSLLICIFFLGDTDGGDALLSPSPSTASKQRGHGSFPSKENRKVRRDGVSPHRAICRVGVQLCTLAYRNHGTILGMGEMYQLDR